MARLRFPGRPGYRFDRLGVRYGVDEGQRGLDPTTRLIANIHRGLRFFREHFGESDEEEEFSGFTSKDIKQATKKYQACLEECQRLQEEDEAEQVPRKSAAKKTVAALVSEGICREAPRKRMSDRVREEVKESKEKIKKIKETAKPTKSGERRPGRPVSAERPKSSTTTLSLDEDSPKKEKKKKRNGRREETKPEQSGRVKAKVLTGPAAKKKDKLDKAKILLAKAREDKKRKTEESKVKQPKQFVLPTVSSRSSRKIKPSKRYIEEYVDYPTVVKKRPRVSDSSGLDDETHSQVDAVVSPVKPVASRTKPTSPPPVPSTSAIATPIVETVKPSISVVTLPQMTGAETMPLSVDIPESDLQSQVGVLLSPRMGLFDQPLIVEGKRQRKPSIKLIRKITDEEYDTRTLENRRKIEERKTQESDVAEMDRNQLAVLERHAEATKRSGQNILRKAKFQLNRAALNRSKAALARQLKRKMKKEGQQGETLHQGQLSPGGFPKPQFGVSPIQLSPLRLGSFGQPLGISALSTGSALSHKMTFLKPGTSPSPLFGGSTCVSLSSKEGSFAATDSAATSSTGRIFGTGSEDGDALDEMATEAGSIPSGSESLKKNKKKKAKGTGTRCAICECECSSRKSAHGGRYLGVPSCEPCSRFYSRRIIQQIRDKVAFVCDKDNKCEITLESKASCVACRYNKCLAMFPLPKIVVLKELKNQGLDDEMCEQALMEFERNQEMMKPSHSSPVVTAKSKKVKKEKGTPKHEADVNDANKKSALGEGGSEGTSVWPKARPLKKKLPKEMRLKFREERRVMNESRKKKKVPTATLR